MVYHSGGADAPRPAADVLSVGGARGGCAEQGWQILQFRDGNHAFCGEHAAAFQVITALPSAPRSATLTRPSRLVLQTFFQWGCGK